MRVPSVLLLYLIAARTLLLTADPADAASLFNEVTAAAALNVPHTLGYDITGQAWGDVDSDGWLDLYVTDALGPNRLYRNNGDGTFTIHPDSATVALASLASGGAVFSDYNNDGWADLYVLNDGANVLFRNNTGTGFTDVTAAAGVGDEGLGTTGSWGDYDGDGHLDLYVANFDCSLCALGSQDVLYHNNGDGTFSDVRTILPGLGSRPVEDTFVAAFVDYDNDGDLDIYAVYDHRLGNDLWRNDGPGCGSWCFTNVSTAAGADTQVEGMGIAINDYDCDGDLDFHFTDIFPAARLLQNQTAQGSPTFVDVTIPAGLSFPASGWGTVFIDYDNDGWPDIYTATTNQSPSESNRLYHNNGDGTFDDVSAASGADNAGPTHGVAYADYDNDGWLDLIIGNLGDAYYLYHNEGSAGAGNHWLSLELQGGGGVNRDGIGARAYVYTSDGRTLLQEVKSGSSLGAGNQRRLHFGLGTSALDSVCVVWPDGTRECDPAPPLDQVVTWVYGPPSSATSTPGARGVSLAQNSPNPFNPSTAIEFHLTRPGRVVLQVLDIHGRRIRTLVDGTRDARRYRVLWDGRDDRGIAVASGVYLYRIAMGTEQETRKMVLLK